MDLVPGDGYHWQSYQKLPSTAHKTLSSSLIKNPKSDIHISPSVQLQCPFLHWSQSQDREKRCSLLPPPKSPTYIFRIVQLMAEQPLNGSFGLISNCPLNLLFPQHVAESLLRICLCPVSKGTALILAGT